MHGSGESSILSRSTKDNMRTLFFILMLLPSISSACESYVIGFKGINNVFDDNAFRQYAMKHKACSLAYSWNQVHTAVKFINGTNKRYQLYGFSKGAESIGQVLRTVKRKPYHIVTIGAYHTANVNYGRYSISTQNYFDSSGRRNASPGTHIRGVDHQDMQRYVNRYYFGIKQCQRKNGC